ncbi:MAG: purine-cytosine permease family protein [Cuniculiplasma sp.]
MFNSADDTLSSTLDSSQRSMKPNSLFYLWFGSNLTVADFALGVLVESYGLSIYFTLMALLIANVFGGLLVALMSILGPRTGMGQMEISKKSFGSGGGRIFSLLQFLNTIGWLSINLIISSRALQFIISSQDQYTPVILGINLLEILSLFIVMTIIGITVIYGHRSIKSFEKIMSVVLGILFVVISISIFLSPSKNIYSYNGNFSLISFASIIMLSFSYIMSWGPYAADYSRYVESKKSASLKSFIYTFLGTALASFLVEVVGFFVGINLNLNGVFSNKLFIPLLGGFWVIGSLTLFLGGLSANALNLYSNLMSIRSLGFKSARRFIIVSIGIFTILTGYLFYNTFSSYFEGFLYVLDYWITPWIGVMIAEYFLVRRKEYYASSINWNPIFSYLISIAISVPFMDTVQYYFGLSIPFYSITSGIDFSYVISFFIAIIVTYLFEEKFGRKTVTSLKRENTIIGSQE